MTADWPAVAERIADALALESGSLVWVRECSGRYEVLHEVLLALERRGATPLVEVLPADYLQRLLSDTPADDLADWDRRRRIWMEQADRMLVLAGDPVDLSGSPEESQTAWQQAAARLEEIEEDRRIPYLLVAIPTEGRARLLGMTFDDLEAKLVSALTTCSSGLQAEIDGLIPLVQDAQQLTIESRDDARLTLDISGRRWLSDAGVMTNEMLQAEHDDGRGLNLSGGIG